ncbi:hypothetical protein ILUMI_08286 [Ignelater luminosus]|uniref:Uncharacterized protein n=1 Tax=Ignelater luminosus TaxID=2038154 RepID=A0A8K0D4Q0_IGNLU|nr:hypothetical protein ILUMI_08286 [Ignelater luminosus]
MIKDTIENNKNMKVLRSITSHGQQRMYRMKDKNELYELKVPNPKANPPKITIRNISSEEIPTVTTQEIHTALQQMKNGRCPEEDRITIEMLIIGGNPIDAIYAYIVQKLKLHDCTEPVKDILRKKSENICKQMRQKWQKSHSSMYNLGHKYSQWLDGYFIFDDIMTHTPTTAKAVGKPAKRFSESSDVTKRRRIHTLLEKSAEELSFATQVTLRAQGLRIAAEMVERVSECSENAQQLKKALRAKRARSNLHPTKL